MMSESYNIEEIIHAITELNTKKQFKKKKEIKIINENEAFFLVYSQSSINPFTNKIISDAENYQKIIRKQKID